MSLVVANGLTKRYGSTTALDQVTLTLEPGPPIALIGPNGAGKTTLLSLLCGFIKPSAGSVQILGNKPGSSSLSGHLAALPQDAVLDPRLGIGRQLRFLGELQGMTRRESRLDVERVLSAVDLSDVVHKKPTELSHGMRKRVSIAQTLLGTPKVVLLDEPTAGIDPPNAKMIRDVVRRESGDITFIVSSHNLDELERLCESVIYLEKGKLLSHGALADENDGGYLTLRLIDVPEEEFLSACIMLPEIMDATRLPQGDFLLKVSDDMLASKAILDLLHQQAWQYRQLSRGRTLEERFYGSTGR